MINDIRLWLIGAGLSYAAWLIVSFLIPPQPPVVEVEDIPVIHYVCQETGELFKLPLTGSLIKNPTTDKLTLVPAVFDSRREKWRPGPPLEVMHRRGLLQPVPTE